METQCLVADSTSAPDVNVYNNTVGAPANYIFSSDVLVNTSLNNTGVTAQATVYEFLFGAHMEVTVDKIGTGDATDAQLTIYFVRE
jgi:hypothetical protein